MLPALRPHLAACLLIPVALGLTACSSTAGSGEAGGEPKVTSTPALLQTAGIAYPLDGYAATYEEEVTLKRAQNILVTQCMAEFGFKYRAPEPPEATKSAPNSRIYGVVDMATATRYGYKAPVASGSEPQKQQVDLSEAETMVLRGPRNQKPDTLPRSLEEAKKKKTKTAMVNGKQIPAGGCGRKSFLELYAPTTQSVDALYVFNLKVEANSRTRKDSRVLAVNKKWSKCMATAGYKVTNPMDPAQEIGLANDALSSPEAINAAKADVTCKEKVNLVGVWYGVETAYQRQSIDRNAEVLDLAKRQLADRLKLAASLSG
ncbi:MULTISPECIES: hypothetical protein [unclassified Streptomyces]|uniref:hypothetical protein n=1 Tax=unclassified Streptomyces TaxID=2593676 RepID=UPI002DDA4C13|nr:MULTISPECIES: hypothetical protein [unclassified Streptomyces]WSC38152.1 hypothetical protein OHA08_23115 [Streptomyces sp. NBC_01763]WSC54721.1 hypothetical protein OG808_21980 [Streptomyces sp. NBC_01761]WSF85558.1 hypothetical protein OIE70_22075 [Streptomyces sp. NBC_01744]WSJ52108.1 hypothetical protein OG243_22600 [Streptomyces sp. NBC_01318]